MSRFQMCHTPSATETFKSLRSACQKNTDYFKYESYNCARDLNIITSSGLKTQP